MYNANASARYTGDPVRVEISSSKATFRPLRHPIKAVKSLGIQTLAGHAGIFAIVALYYILFQTHVLDWLVQLFGSNQTMKEFWDSLFSIHIPIFSSANWDTYRHLVRNVGEYFLGSMLLQQVAYNPFKFQKKIDKKRDKLTAAITASQLAQEPYRKRVKLYAKYDRLQEGGWLDRLEIRLHIPNRFQGLHDASGRRLSPWQLLAAPFLAFFVYAIPGYASGYGVTEGLKALFNIHTLSPALSAHPNILAKLYSASADEHIIGALAGIFAARRVMRPVYAYVQHYFAERRVALGKGSAWWQPYAFQTLVEQIDQKHGQQASAAAQNKRSNLIPWLMMGGGVVLIGLAGYGYYILQYIA